VKGLQHRALDALRRELERQSSPASEGVLYATPIAVQPSAVT
jgi:hypothetical protein